MEEKGKKLGLGNLVGFGLGNCIGTGIFIMLGFGIAQTGRSISLGVIVAAAFILMTTWASFAMCSMFVFKGGDYSIRLMLFPPLVTGMSSWFTVLGALGFSSMSVSFTSYLCVVFPQLTPYSTLVAFVYTTLMFAVTVRGSRFLTLIQNTITVVLVIALTTFILFGVGNVNPANFFSATYDGGFFRNGFSGLVGGISIISYACMGAAGCVSMAAVAKKPKRNVPLAMLLITMIVAVIYSLMAYVASGVLPYDQIAGQNISVTAQKIFPTALYIFFVSGGGLCAIASSSLSTLGMMRYPLGEIAKDGWLPAVFKRQTKSGYPYVSYALYYLLAILPLAMNLKLDAIVSLVNVPLQLLNAIACICCFTIPEKYPEQWNARSLRMPKAVYKAGCILGACCGLGISYTLFGNLAGSARVLSAVSVLGLVGLSALRLKQGAVDIDKLMATKNKIIEDAISASAAADAAE